jgi:fructokinase
MNVACGLGLLGIPVRFLTYIGWDADAQQVLERLHASHVEVVEGSQTAERTATALATIDDDGIAQYDFDVEWELHGLSGLRVPKWIHIGSISTFLSPGADSLETFLAALTGGPQISYDPNIRPQLLPDHALALKRFEIFAGMSNVVKLSDDDAHWLYPGRSIGFVTDRILSFGVNLVVITAGSRGAMLVSNQGEVEVCAPRVNVVDTVGAGDSFMSALLAQLIALEGLPPSLSDLAVIGNEACVAAAITCARVGSQPPSRDELVAAR